MNLVISGGIVPTGIAVLNSPAFTGSPTAPTPTSGDNSTKIATTAYVQGAVNGQLSLGVAGNSNVTLTAAQAGNGILNFSGALTGNISVIVPGTTGKWAVENNTTGAFTLTVKTAAGTGVAITQGKSNSIICDGTNVVPAQNDFVNTALTGVPTVPTAAVNTSTTQAASTAYVVNQGYLTAVLAASTYAPLASPTLTGVPLAPTAAINTNTAQLATCAFVINQAYAPLANAALTGAPTSTTPAQFDNSTKIATTAFVNTFGKKASGITTINVSGSIPLSAVGGLVLFTGSSSFTATLPASGTVTNGCEIDLVNTGSGVITLARTGTDNISFGKSTGTTIQLQPGDNLIVQATGAGWQCDGGSAILGYSYTRYSVAAANRIANTNYVNNTGKLMIVNAIFQHASLAFHANLYSGSTGNITTGDYMPAVNAPYGSRPTITVLPGENYGWTFNNGLATPSIVSWVETY